MGAIVAVDQNRPAQEAVERGAALLADGGVLVMPTDSVYGIGCAALAGNPALRRIFSIKRRDRAQTLPWLVADAADLAGEVARDGDGRLATPDFLGLARVAGAAFEPLAPSYPVFRGGSTAPVKALLLWGRPLLMSGYVGLFWAPTGEAGVPVDCAAADLPFVMCHEAAHRLGIAGEGEANFAAYLACEASDDARLGYAGSYSAFCYCLNALAAQDPERARQVVADAAAGPEAEGVLLVLQDRADAIEHYEAYRSGFERVGDAVNETYLTSFGEEEGVRSYGLVVDYLIAWRKARPGS